MPDDYYDDDVECETCGDEGVFHEERATSGGDIADVITGYCPDCNERPVLAVEPVKDGEQ